MAEKTYMSVEDIEKKFPASHRRWYVAEDQDAKDGEVDGIPTPTPDT